LVVGDTVVLQKAGGVIPEIVRVGGKHTKPRPLFSLPDHIDHKCPSCGSSDIIKDGERYLCGNTAGCKAQMAARVEHMASRGCLNIMGLGAEACDAIAQLGEIEHPFDILDKPVEWFANLAWVTDTGKNMTFGKARATKVVEACCNIGKQPLHRWIAALGIHSVGENTSKEISRLCEDTNELTWACRASEPVKNPSDGIIYRIAKGDDKTVGDLAKFAISNHLGPVSCNELVNFVASESGLTLLRRSDEYGVQADNYSPIPETKTDGALTGKTFAITGTLSQPRDYFKALIQDAGGKVTDTISAKLTALVCGEGGGGKRDKAAKLGIPVWDEAQLMKEVAV
jgi:DNA ligase (NAD+)